MTTLVLPATGKTGRRVADRLTAMGVDVRAGSRSTTPAFDWNRPDTWAGALDGVDAVYIAYVPDVAIPGSADAIDRFTAQALAAGVERLVLLSGRGEEEAQQAEHRFLARAPHGTVVRCAWFAQNFSEAFFLDGVLDGEFVAPVGAVTEPFVDCEDIADVAVAALTENTDRHQGQTYELTGPRLLSFEDALDEIARATGRGIRFATVPMDDFARGLADAGEPEEVVWLIRYLFTEVFDGRNEHLADGVQRALGRPPRDFADYARDTAATGVWAGQARV